MRIFSDYLNFMRLQKNPKPAFDKVPKESHEKEINFF